MGKTLIRLAVSVLCNVVAVLLVVWGALFMGSPWALGIYALVLVLVSLFIKPPAYEVDIVLDAMRHDIAKR